MLKAKTEGFDWLLLFSVLLLVVLGVLTIYSALFPLGEGPRWENPVFRQAIFAIVGIGVYVIFALVDYRIFARMSLWVYVSTLVLLTVILLVGSTSFGAQSWLDLESFDVQPSELAKVLMILVMARILDGERYGLDGLLPLLISALALTLPVFLIYEQPDFGTALVLLATWLSMVFLAGVRWEHLLLLGLVALLVVPLAWFQMEDYMRGRIASFLFPSRDPSGASYNVTQALISIGSGGWWGKGLFQGTQSHLRFLRVRHTDFIFSVFAEELGFVGSILLLGLFAFLILRIVGIAVTAKDRYGCLVAGGVASMLFVQVFINLGMNANMLPVTGLPLPLVSYGGSSLLTTLLALGLVESVAVRRGSGAAWSLR